MIALLDNITWHTLAGPHARFATGAGGARRYTRGFSPILGFAEPQRPDFASLAPHCERSEHFYCENWSGAAPDGWQVEAETAMTKMIWEAAPPALDTGLAATPLDAGHAQQALDLATLTRPGPFGLRTIELGTYLGLFEDGALVAMAGERMQAGCLHEISGVCTRPDRQGRGLARRLMLALVRQQLLRGEVPFLHVMRDNVHAHALYRRMGFRDYRDVTVRVVSLR